MISCKEYSAEYKKILKCLTSNTESPPTLAVIQVDDNPASTSYIKGKRKDCEEAGIGFIHQHVSSADTSQSQLELIVDGLNNDYRINGIIIQLPIPDKYDLKKLLRYISPEKDVDGFLPDSYFKQCTPKGIIDWMEANGQKFSGVDITVIGRSDIVGKPLVNMLIERGATVTCCNSKTQGIERYTRDSDIVISAVGKPKQWDSRYFSSKTKLIVDVGINRVDGKLCGDVDYDNVSENFPSIYITPVPSGVGLLTRLALLRNVYKAYSIQNTYKEN